MPTVTNNPMQTFLNKYKVKQKGDPYNVTNIGAPWGSFLVPNEKLDACFKLYVELIDKHKVMPVLTEKQGPFAPVVLDFDYKFTVEKTTRQFDFALISEVAVAYVTCFKSYLEMQEGQADCFVDLKPAPYQPLDKKGNLKDHMKDGFHLMWPFLRCSAPLKHLARLHVIENCNNNIMSVNPTNTPDDIVDTAVIDRKIWFTFGSGKPYGKPYSLVTVLKFQSGKTTESADTHYLAELVKLRIVNRDDGNVSYISGVTEASRAELLAEKVEKPLSKPMSKLVAKRMPTDTTKEHNEAIQEFSFELLEKVIMALSLDHASASEPIWEENIVWPVINISSDNRYPRKGANLIHCYSKQCPPMYEEEEVERNIDDAKTRYRKPGEICKQFGSLVSLLQQDEPPAYSDIFNKPRTDYAPVKKDFEIDHFKIMDPLSYATFNHGKNTFRRWQDMIPACENKLINQDDKQLPLSG